MGWGSLLWMSMRRDVLGWRLVQHWWRRWLGRSACTGPPAGRRATRDSSSGVRRVRMSVRLGVTETSAFHDWTVSRADLRTR